MVMKVLFIDDTVEDVALQSNFQVSRETEFFESI